MQQTRLLCVGGATASGKTSLAIRLANRFDIPIISADSRQFYREMSIGTAKPTSEELAQAPHYFINHLSIGQDYTVGDYEREVIQLLNEIPQKDPIAVVVGGSGLFLRAIIEGLDEFPEVPKAIKVRLEEEWKQQGLSVIQQRLQEVDPAYYAEVDIQNPVRILRALSVYEASGKPFSSFRKKEKAQRPFRAIKVQIAWERAALYERINRRVDLMMEQGLEQEARNLYPFRHLTPLQTVGYQELFDYFDGLHDRATAIELIKRNSRRYAKRQMTWFRNGGWREV